MMQITVEISDELETAAHNMAARTHRKVEDIIQDWLDQCVSETPVDWLGDGHLLDLIARQLPDDHQTELSDLLEINRERIMSPNERKRLDELMQIYGQGMVRKAEATKEAVKRGLISPLG
jgi:hypothetical protein